MLPSIVIVETASASQRLLYARTLTEAIDGHYQHASNTSSEKSILRESDREHLRKLKYGELRSAPHSSRVLQHPELMDKFWQFRPISAEAVHALYGEPHSLA